MVNVSMELMSFPLADFTPEFVAQWEQMYAEFVAQWEQMYADAYDCSLETARQQDNWLLRPDLAYQRAIDTGSSKFFVLMARKTTPEFDRIADEIARQIDDA